MAARAVAVAVAASIDPRSVVGAGAAVADATMTGGSHAILGNQPATESHPPLTPPEPPGQTPDIVANDGSGLTVTFDRHNDPHRVVVDVTGDLDALTAPRLLDTLHALLRERSAVLVVDLTAVAFMGSGGISVLVEIHQRASPYIDLRVVAASRVTLRPLQATGIDTALNVYVPRRSPHPDRRTGTAEKDPSRARCR